GTRRSGRWTESLPGSPPGRPFRGMDGSLRGSSRGSESTLAGGSTMRTRSLAAGAMLALLGAPPPALAEGQRELRREHCLRVPQRYSTIQAAVDAANDGDQIVVSRGRFCGATLTRRVSLQARPGATIVGCDAPVSGPYRVGFLLTDARASGSSIR